MANSAALFRTIKKVPHLHEILKEVQGVRRKPEESPQLLREQQKVQQKALEGMTFRKASKLKFIALNALKEKSTMEMIEREFEEVVWSIEVVKQKSEEGFEGKNTLNMNDIVKSLIRLTDVGENNIVPPLRKLSMKILRKIILLFEDWKGVAGSQLSGQLYDWVQQDEESFEKDLIKRQDKIASFGLIDVICRIVAFESKRLLKEEVIQLAISILKGGNTNS